MSSDFAGLCTNLMVGVFDGHGGDQVSQHLSEQFMQRFLHCYSSEKEIGEALTKSTL